MYNVTNGQWGEFAMSCGCRLGALYGLAAVRTLPGHHVEAGPAVRELHQPLV